MRSCAKAGCGLAFVGAAIFMPMSAQAGEGAGFYGSLRAGTSLLQSMNFAEASTANLALNPAAGFVVGGAAGFHVTDDLRLELDLSYARNDLVGRFQQNVQAFVPCGQVAGNPCLSSRVDGDIASTSGFGMAYYDLPVIGPLKPHLGLGVGLVSVDMGVGASATMNNGTASRFTVIDGSNTLLGYRGDIGVAYDLGDIDLTLGYTYTLTDRLGVAGKGTLVSFDFDRRPTTHAISAGVSYEF